MLKWLGIYCKSTWLIASLLISASYQPVLAQSPGCTGGFDCDNDVDLLDYAEFSNCLSGPGGAGCPCFDLNGDVDIDLPDFSLFWQSFTGPYEDCAPGLGQSNCGGCCIDVWWDQNNCGACGNQCAPQDHCNSGQCEPCGSAGPCFGGFLFCDGVCRNVGLDPSNCGCCGHHCDDGQYCAGGFCWDAATCPDCSVGGDPIPGDFDDDGDIDLIDFAEFQVCTLGPDFPQTDPLCTDARLDADQDVDLDDFEVFAGCLSGPDDPADPNCACLPDETNCDGTCVRTASDEANCGACGSTCTTGQHCQSGSCHPCESDDGRYLLCGGVCVDSWVDVGNCGGCGIICGGGQTCQGGTCQDQEPCKGC